MSEIAKLYNDVMAGVEAEKLAADQTADHVAYDIETEDEGVEINAEFFSKVASGDEEAVEVMNNFIEEARAEGASDEEIEAAIAEAMQEAGIEDIEASDEEWSSDDVDDEFEVQKAAAYLEGAETAVVDALESELAKEAGVTADDLVEYELGSYYGAGYAETRAELDAVVEKIAAHKKESGARMEAAKAGAKKVMEGVKSMAGKGAEKAKSGGKRYKELLTGSNLGATGLGRATTEGKEEARKVLMTRIGTGAVGTAGLAGGGAMAYNKMKKKKDN